MSEKFLDVQLNRAVWVAMIEQDKIAEAVNLFEIYKKKLMNINSKEAKDELKYSYDILVEKFIAKAEEYVKNKDYTQALICYKYIYEADNKNEENIKKYIMCLDKSKQHDLQLRLAKRLIKLNGNSANYKILSSACDKNDDFKSAIKFYNKHLFLLKKKRLDANDNNALGCFYFNSYVKKGQNPEDAEMALSYFRKAVAEVKDNKAFLKNTIVAAMKAKDYKVEKKCWDSYIKYGYMDGEEEFTYCASCMRNGDIKEWAKHYGSRFGKTEPTIYPQFDKPEWTGKEDISDKTLLIHYEQGYGDNFLMFGYMPRLVKKAKKVIYYIQNNAYDLVKNNEFGVEIYCQKTKDLKEIEFDYHLPSMSIPIALDLDKDTLSVGGGYIKPNEKEVEKYRKKYFDNDKFKIGFAFLGVNLNQKRDIPFEHLLQLDKLNNVELYCFSKDVDDKLLQKFKRNKVVNIAKDFETFADTANALQNVDILISSDNGVLNLAGAIGKKTLGIFNYHYEFRWYDLTGEDCGWFNCIKPIVNNAYNDWSISMKTAIEEVKKEMKNKA